MLAGQVGLLQGDAARRRRGVVRPADVALMSAFRLLDVSMSDGLLILGQLLLLSVNLRAKNLMTISFSSPPLASWRGRLIL